MNYFAEKFQEITTNIWAKLLLAIPVCFLHIEEREGVMLFALLAIIAFDTFLGAMLAFHECRFSWSDLSKKFSKKFILYFVTLLASFVLSKAYYFVDWWLYLVGTLLVFSEFGSLMQKAGQLGLPIPTYYITLLNKRLEEIINAIIGKK